MLRQKGKRLSISSRLRLFLNILNSSMKSLLLITALVIISGLFARAANAEQEKAFVEKYKTAPEANDSATLQSVLYTNRADPMIVGFYKMMKSIEARDKVSNIVLVDLTLGNLKH